MAGKLRKDATNVEDVALKLTQEGSVYHRIKNLQYATMYNMYSDAMQDYNENMLRYHEKRSSLLQQQRRLVRKQITSEELEDLLDSQETSLFVDNILKETKIAQQQLSDIQTRHDELQKLEKSVTEVKDIFLEMAFLVEQQGDQVDCVEKFANRATDDVDGGRDKLLKKDKQRKKLRKIRKKSLMPSNSFLRNVHKQITHNKRIHELLEQVEETRELIDTMIKSVVIVKSIQNEALSMHTNRDIENELRTRTQAINALAHRISGKLKVFHL
ncbi:syntaxin [Copidosoma floridanum]|uniref:syntaxin n=1 Tax=Copidosoma floridanum TaxID=29053 RepID=UPI0006C96551|nr:syntaxin [Copidosoma floridanum]